MHTKPILIDLPEQFESERLILRASRFGDGAELNRAVIESFAELNRWMPWAKERPSLEESESYCRAARARFLTREDLTILIFLKSSGELVGSTGFHRINWDVPSVEIGYWCATKHTGKGYITEATRALTLFAFETLRAARVELRIDASNKPSIAVVERLNFTLEGVLRNEGRNNAGELRDMAIYALTERSGLK